MSAMPAKLSLLSIALLLSAVEIRAQTAEQVKLTECVVTLSDGRELEVPALVAGQLVSLEVREGREVEAGTVLGRIDDKQAQANREEREAEVEVAREQAENDVNVRFARASLLVAEQELKANKEVNKKAPGTISQTEMLRLALTVDKTSLQIEVAQMEQRVAKLTMGAKKARLKEIDGVIERSEIKAPVSGLVVDVLKHRGEWCEPGAIVLRIAPLEVLRVDGFVNASVLAPADVSNRPVTVQVKLAGGQVEQFQGKIVYADPRVQSKGEYRVYAEVTNKKNRDHWLLRPGSAAEMVIDLRGGLAQPKLPPAGQSAQPGLPMRR
jgi:multidrug efflux pump subunit AcrA (membrane-fusion protein)